MRATPSFASDTPGTLWASSQHLINGSPLVVAEVLVWFRTPSPLVLDCSFKLVCWPGSLSRWVAVLGKAQHPSLNKCAAALPPLTLLPDPAVLPWPCHITTAMAESETTYTVEYAK